MTMDMSLREDLKELKNEFEFLEQAVPDAQVDNYRQFHDRLMLMSSKLTNLESERQMYKDMAQTLKGDVKVLCRVRPTNSSDKGEMSCRLGVVSERELEVRGDTKKRPKATVL